MSSGFTMLLKSLMRGQRRDTPRKSVRACSAARRALSASRTPAAHDIIHREFLVPGFQSVTARPIHLVVELDATLSESSFSAFLSVLVDLFEHVELRGKVCDALVLLLHPPLEH